jgi:hypothetical protein
MSGPPLTREDIKGYAFGLLLLAAVFSAILIGPRLKASNNFLRGPGWDCSNPGKGEPVCVRYPTNLEDGRSESVAPRP